MLVPFRRKMLGLELNDTLLKLVELHKQGRKVRLEQMVAHPLPSVWSKDGEFIEQEALIQSVREALLGRRFATRKVHLALNSRHVTVQRKRVPILSERRLKKWIQKQIIPSLPLPYTEVVFDYIRLDKHEIEQEQDLLLIVASKNYVETLAKIIEYSGLEPISLDLSSLGLYRWLSYNADILPTQLLTLHFSVNGVECSWFKDGDLQAVSFLSLEMSTFRDGPDHPHPDPLKPILLSEEEVERYGKELLPLVNEQVEQWKKKLGWEPTQWILTGDGIDFPLLQKWLVQQTGDKVMHGTTPHEILSPALQVRVSRWLGSAMSVPIGLLLHGRELA